MKGKAVWGILSTLLLVSVLTSAFIVQPVKAEPGTVYINADGSITPPTAPISTVNNVTYTFIGNVNEPIVVQKDNIVIDGNGYTLQGSMSGNGIELSSTNNVTIKNTNIKDFSYGVQLDSSSNSTVYGNSMTNNTQYGVYLNSSFNCAVFGNNITNNGVFGISLLGSSSNNISRNNVANNDGGIGLSFSSSNSISGNNMTDNTEYGVDLEFSSNDTVSGNSIEMNITYMPNEFGVFLGSSSNNTISKNNITSNGAFTMDPIFYPPTGVMIWGSSYNRVSENNITNNAIGVALFSSSNNTFSANTITKNQYGIVLTARAPTYNAPFVYSLNNVIYHNNFINNTQQAIGGLQNVWDNGYPSGGNFWGDYNGTDLKRGPYQNVIGSDGIGDTPYVIDVNNTDDYPLMGEFSDFSVAEGVDVQVVSNSTLSDFQFNGTAILFDVSGVKGTTGFCNVCVPIALLNGNLTVLVNETQVQYTLLPISNNSNSYLYFNYSHSTEQVTIMSARSVSQGNSYAVPFVAAVVIAAAAIALYVAVVARREGKKRPSDAREPS